MALPVHLQGAVRPQMVLPVVLCQDLPERKHPLVVFSGLAAWRQSFALAARRAPLVLPVAVLVDRHRCVAVEESLQAVRQGERPVLPELHSVEAACLAAGTAQRPRRVAPRVLQSSAQEGRPVRPCLVVAQGGVEVGRQDLAMVVLPVVLP